VVELLSTAPAADIRSDALRNRDRILEVAKAKLRAGEASLRMNDIAKEAASAWAPCIDISLRPSHC